MDRRQVLKAAGATSTIPLASEPGVASGDDRPTSSRDRRACPQPHCIHPVFGYTGLEEDEQLPQSMRPDYEVDLRIRPRENRPVPEFFFDPTGLIVETGDVVRFDFATPEHTVTAYHPNLGRQRRIPEGVPPFSSPVLGMNAFWLYRFDEPGVYDVLCAPHEIYGMVARIVVGEPTADFGPKGNVKTDGGEVELRPPALTAALVYDDPMMDPMTIAAQGTVNWADLASESKRLLVEFPEPAGESD
ncbi:cupredoxin domain-containing protein [Natrinema halophilum]|uniref:Blue (type 1) copper domain-containing protein n=1 Tax=Natrinema halophilum TaxID=1699371 RepID=A0A7D5KC06_9EURY|nr:plastocyanin/azurin family copper-binding protein [Natrinema halophilum]QLG48181.1 hypothetical protein HYG82_04625 [Natrinema halophilum]